MDDVLSQTLLGRPPGGTILLSHTPWQAEICGERRCWPDALWPHPRGAGLAPSAILVSIMYPLLEGRYEVGGMPVIVLSRNGHVGTSHATLASQRDSARGPAREGKELCFGPITTQLSGDPQGIDFERVYRVCEEESVKSKLTEESLREDEEPLRRFQNLYGGGPVSRSSWSPKIPL